MIPALSAALVGGFKSFPVTLIAALLLGVAESEITNYVTTPGYQQAAPFIVVIIILVIRGEGLPLRSFVLDRLPRVGSGRIHALPVLIGTGPPLLIFNSGPDGTGVRLHDLARGRLPLRRRHHGICRAAVARPVRLAGLGALIGAKLAMHLPFLLMLLVTVVITAVIGCVIGLPALRTRGATLAIVTWASAARSSRCSSSTATTPVGRGASPRPCRTCSA